MASNLHFIDEKFILKNTQLDYFLAFCTAKQFRTVCEMIK